MRLASLAFVAAVVTGCVTPEMRAAREADADKTCQSYGAKPGTDVYVQCRLQFAKMNQQADQDRSRRLLAAGAQLNAASQPQNVSCSRTLSGGMDCHRW